MIDVDMLIVNGKIATMDKKNPKIEAIAIRNGKILAVGNTKEIKDNYSSKEVIDLQGKFMCPGFYDAHTHLIAVGAKLVNIQLQDVKSP
ncbi:MAG: amidohydrolase family protein, partial [Candidatus Heimdallarchaeota archaeon]